MRHHDKYNEVYSNCDLAFNKGGCAIVMLTMIISIVAIISIVWAVIA